MSASHISCSSTCSCGTDLVYKRASQLARNARLNTDVSLDLPDSLKPWLKEKHTLLEQKRLSSLITTTSVFPWTEKNDQNIKERVEADLGKVVSTVESVRARCREERIKILGITTPFERSLKVFEYILLSFHCLVDEIVVNSPDPLPIQKKWSQFQLDLAILRYRKNPEIVLKIQEFFNHLSEEIQKYGPAIERGHFFQSFRTILEMLVETPDTLDLSLAYLISDRKIGNVKASIASLVETFQERVHLLEANLLWLFPQIEAKLGTVKEKIPPRGNVSTELLPRLNIFQLCSLQTLKKLIACDDPDKIINEGYRLISSLTTLFEQIERVGAIVVPGIPHKTVGNLDEHIQSNEWVVSVLEKHNPAEGIACSLVSLPINVAASLYTSTPTWCLQDYRDYLYCLKQLQNVHIWMNTFVMAPINILRKLFQVIYTWKQTHKRGYGRLLGQYKTHCQEIHRQRALFEISKSAPFSPPARKVRGGRRQKKTRERRSSHTRKTSTTKPTPVRRPPSTTASSSSAAATAPSPILSPSVPFSPLHGPTLEKLLSTAKLSRVSRGPARQALMYLRDIQANQRQAERAFTPHHLPQTLFSTYFAMEQVLRYQNERKHKATDRSFAVHNLYQHLHHLSLEDSYDTKIARTLFHANAWLQYTYPQMEVRRRIERHRGRKAPAPLVELFHLFENPKGVDPARVQHLCQSYLTDTLKFVQQFHEIQELSGSSGAPLPTPFDLRPLTKTLPYKQISATLLVLKGVYSELNQYGTSPDTASLCTRMAIYWEGQLMDKLLKTLITEASATHSIHEHDLVQLTRNIEWQEGEREVILPLFEQMNQWHNVARYPFEYSEVISPLHQLVLIAEMIRNGSGTPSGFQPQDKESLTSTPIDFIGIPTAEVTCETLFEGLYQFHNSCRKACDILISKL